MFLIGAAYAARGCAVARTSTSYLIHVARFNLGIVMRAMFGPGTPREATSARHALLFVVQTDSTLAIAVISAVDGETAMLFIIIAPKRLDQNSDFVTGLLRTVAQDGHVRRIDEIVIGIEQGQLRRLRRCRCFLEGSFLTGPSLGPRRGPGGGANRTGDRLGNYSAGARWASGPGEDTR
jgi:hypothetical protein